MSDFTYKILIDYQDGDSYGYSRHQQELELKWKDLEVAKSNLQRIKEHYLWYEKCNDRFSSYKEKQKWRDKKPRMAQ